MSHYFIASLRRMWRESYYTSICVASLSLGIACALVISLYLYSELSYDHYHDNHQSIYRATTEFGDVELLSTGYDIGPHLQSEHPQIEEYVTQKYDALLPLRMLEIYYPEFTSDRVNRYFAAEIFTYLHIPAGIDEQEVAATAATLSSTA